MSSHSGASRSLLSIDDLSKSHSHYLIGRASQLKRSEIHPTPPDRPLIVSLAFFEASTRTRMSFEIAANRLSVRPVVFTADATTSVAKGETIHETLNTLLAMKPDILVVRYGQDGRVDEILKNSDLPVVSAGTGVLEHPTQALLDAMTIQERLGSIEKQKILYVGDVEHSRVASSGIRLFKKLGAEVAVCSPKELMAKATDLKRFEKLKDGLSWCTVCIGLRVQKERHSSASILSQGEYIEKYRLDKKNLAPLSLNALILHPGPFVPDVDLSEEVLADARCVIHEQVTNGVYMRMAILGDILGLSYS